MRAFACALALAVTMTAPPLQAQVLDFESLDGWEQDDHRAALTAFLATCDKISGDDWAPICAFAHDANRSDASAKAFFELMFKPVQIGNPPALFTGYFEPEHAGSPIRTPRFAYPLYARPPELQDGQTYYSRAQIEAGALRGRGLEIAWLEDPVEVFFLQVQGSGRIHMTNGHVIRVGYAGRNGYPYVSVGQTMIARGMRTPDQVSAQDIRAYVRSNPMAGMELLNVNPSYIFFRKIDELAIDQGPIGALGRPITPMRSVAVDPDYTQMGAPVWIEKAGADPIRSLMVAQDTGGAIKGAQRADIFYGTGDAAGEAAGTVKDGGRMIVLLPIDRAFALLPEG
jgi:membrane-bound lytic murein transglycosylase A